MFSFQTENSQCNCCKIIRRSSGPKYLDLYKPYGRYSLCLWRRKEVVFLQTRWLDSGTFSKKMWMIILCPCALTRSFIFCRIVESSGNKNYTLISFIIKNALSFILFRLM